MKTDFKTSETGSSLNASSPARRFGLVKLAHLNPTFIASLLGEMDGAAAVGEAVKRYDYGKTASPPAQFFTMRGSKVYENVLLERFKKYHGQPAEMNGEAVFLGFSFVFAQSQAMNGMLLRSASLKHQKSSLRLATVFFKAL